LKEQRPLKFEPELRTGPAGHRPSRLGPAAAIGFATLAAGMVAFAVSPSLRDFAKPSLPTLKEDRTTALRPPAAAAPIQAASAPIAASCADPSANGLIKAELFKRAAQLRPAERAQLERMASHAHLRIDSTSARNSGAGTAGCSGWLAINLPRGLVVDGSRSNLNAEAAFGLVREEGSIGRHSAAVQRPARRLRIFQLHDDRLCLPSARDQRHHGREGPAVGSEEFMPGDRNKARQDFRRMLKWIVVVAVATVVAALFYLHLTGELSPHMVIATILGVFFSVLLGAGLMAASYFSDKSGHDRDVRDATIHDREP
jgi:hypothetical protein